MNQMATYIMECGGMERIEQLQMHDNNNIYNKALKLLERYFGVEDEEDNGIAPVEAEGAQQFAFGQPAQAAADATFGAQPAQGGFNFGTEPAQGGFNFGAEPAKGGFNFG